MNGLANWEAEGRKRTVKVAAAIQRVAAREMEGVVETHGREDEEEAGENPLSRWEGRVRTRRMKEQGPRTHENDVQGEPNDGMKGVHGGLRTNERIAHQSPQRDGCGREKNPRREGCT